MNKMEDFLTATRLNDLLRKKEEDEKSKNTALGSGDYRSCSGYRGNRIRCVSFLYSVLSG